MFTSGKNFFSGSSASSNQAIRAGMRKESRGTLALLKGIFRRCSSTLVIPAVLFTLAATAYLGCLKTPPVSPNAQSKTPPSQLTLLFVTNQVNTCVTWLESGDLNGDLSPQGLWDSNAARTDWRASRHYYEQVRFAFDAFDLSLQNDSIAPWFDNPLSTTNGFHFIERNFWKIPFNAYNVFHTVYPQLLVMWTGVEVPAIINVMGNENSDSNIFGGLMGMLADIDSIKLTKADSNFSRNTLNDVFSNLEGLDSVIGYYVPLNTPYSNLPDSLRAVDSTFNAAYQTIWSAWQGDTLNNGAYFYSPSFSKSLFEQAYLYPLDSAVAHIADSLKIRIQ